MRVVFGSGSPDTCRYSAHQYMAHAGEQQNRLYRIDEGWACRFRLLSDGRRQITALFLPGELCEPQWALKALAAQSITAVTNMRVSIVATRSFKEQMTDLDGEIIRSLLAYLDWQSDWLVSLGRKSAIERLSEFFCTIFERMRRAGLTYGDQCAMPLTQTDLADLAGLTAVHVNRVLQELREKKILELHSKWLRILDMQELRHMAGTPLPNPRPIRTEKPLIANLS